MPHPEFPFTKEYPTPFFRQAFDKNVFLSYSEE